MRKYEQGGRKMAAEHLYGNNSVFSVREIKF